MNFSIFDSPRADERTLAVKFTMADMLNGFGLKIYDRFIDYVAKYCAKQYIREHSKALRETAEMAAVRYRVHKALRNYLKEIENG